MPGSSPSPALQNWCLVAPGLWQYGSPLMAAPCHLASVLWDAADSMLAQKARAEVWRRKGAHTVREETRDMAPSLGAHPEGNSPQQRGHGIITKKSACCCFKTRKLCSQAIMEYKVSCFAMAVERQLLFFTAPRNTEMPEKTLLPFPMLQSLQPPMQQSQPCRSTGTTLPAQR